MPGADDPSIFRRPEEIVVADHLGSGRVDQRDKTIERNHLAAAGTHIERSQVLCISPEVLIGLQVHLVGAVVKDKVVHIRRAHVHLQRIADLRHRHVQHLGFLAIDADLNQGVVGCERSEQSRQLVALPAAGNNLIGDTGEIGERVLTRCPATQTEIRQNCRCPESQAARTE